VGDDTGPPLGPEVGVKGRHGVRLHGGADAHAGVGEVTVQDPAVLHHRGEQAQRDTGHLGPADPLPVRQFAVLRGQQQIALAVQRNRAYVAERLPVHVTHPHVEVELGQPVHHFPRRHRFQRDPDLAVLVEERRGQQLGGGQRRRDGSHPQHAGQPAVHRREVVAQGVALRQNPAGPHHHPLALGGKALEAPSPSHDHDLELTLQRPDTRGERRLGHMAGLGGPREVAFACQRGQILELSQQHG
jgi:hypothetical protein